MSLRYLMMRQEHLLARINREKSRALRMSFIREWSKNLFRIEHLKNMGV